ncbi:MAG: PASTA domain-containing protein [Clostridia bacterium]|nr:PASTA domain-containing protein [Clostridia bacterium]
MINSENLCMSCMRDTGGAQQCPHCGYNADTPQTPPYLPVRTVISGRYIVGRLLEYNGDGATYIAWDMSEQKVVRLREFLPDTLCNRKAGEKAVTVMSGCETAFNDCLADFLELWRRLTRMSGLSALDNVLEVFEENSTAYAVTDYIETISLRDYLLRNKAGYISWERARSLFMPVLSTLGMLHTAGIIHRGISPVTLLIGRDAKMRISGFSISQARTARGDLTAQLFPGYAAVEQYGFEGKQGPWTDIYAFAATLYRALIGTDPIEATERLTNDRLMVPGKFAEQLPAYVINGLINALQILPEDRTRSVEQFRAELSASPTATASDFAGAAVPEAVNEPGGKPQPEKKPVPKKQPAGNNGKKLDENKLLILKTALISAIIGLVIFLLVVLIFGDKIGFTSPEQETEVSTRNELVPVPNFVNRNYAEVTATPFWTNNFVFERAEAYSDTISKGYIIKQSVPAETEVNAGTKIVLTVSLGIEQFELPYVIGMDFEDAAERLRVSNFKVSKELIENDGTHTAGVVQSVANLTVGKSYPKGTEVTLVVWDEAPTEAPLIPPVDEPSSSDDTSDTQEPSTDEPAVENTEENTEGALTPAE